MLIDEQPKSKMKNIILIDELINFILSRKEEYNKTNCYCIKRKCKKFGGKK